MRHILGLALAAGAGLLALAFSDKAVASYNPILTVSSGSEFWNAQEFAATLSYEQGPNDDATAQLRFYAPPGTEANLTQSPGATVGLASARVSIGAAAGAEATLGGFVLVGDGSDLAIQAQSTACTGVASHDAVWILALTLQDQPLNVPVFVDRTTGAEAAFSSYKLTVCFRSPYIPAELGGQPLGVKPLEASIGFGAMFSYTTGALRWTGLFVPYAVGTGTPNPATAAESQAVVDWPISFRIAARSTVKRKRVGKRVVKTFWATITGRLQTGGEGRAGGDYTLSTRARNVASGRTNASGAFTKTVRLTRARTAFQATVNVAMGGSSQLDCAPLVPLAPGLDPHCSGVTRAGLYLRSNEVTVRQRR